MYSHGILKLRNENWRIVSQEWASQSYSLIGLLSTMDFVNEPTYLDQESEKGSEMEGGMLSR